MDQREVGNPTGGEIVVRRRASFADRFRRYNVRIAGRTAARIGAGNTVTIPLTQGMHSVKLTIDWCSSNELLVDVRAGDSVKLICGSNLTGWRILLALVYATLLRRHYLWIRFRDRTSSPDEV